MKTSNTTTKLVRVTYWAGQRQETIEVSSYVEAIQVINENHRNAFDPSFSEISTGKQLFDDGNGLCYEDQSLYVI